jgi:tripartite-type tricarboxylate transporter receptor subunit TctC
VKHAAPDGYTLFFTGTAALTMVPNMNKDVTFRVGDFIPIGNLTGTSTIMVVRTDLPYAQDAASFRAFAKANPGKINFGSAGTGTLTHILGALVMVTGDLSFTHVPYKGSADVVQAMLGGTVDVLFGLPSNALTHIRAGKMRALTSSGATRSEFFPDVPTMREAGFDFVDLSRFGLFAPRGLADPIMQSLATAVEESVKSAEYVEAMRKITTSALHHPPAEYRKILEDEDRRWRNLLADPKFTAAMQ